MIREVVLWFLVVILLPQLALVMVAIVDEFIVGGFFLRNTRRALKRRRSRVADNKGAE